MPLLEIISIIISVTATIVTVIAFFASLKFYRDGMELQNTSTRILAQIEERTGTIQLQMQSAFDKTLDAALGSRTGPGSDMSEASTKLVEELKTTIETIQRFQSSSEQEKEAMLDEIQESLSTVATRVETLQEMSERLDRYFEEERVLATLVGGAWKSREMIAENLKFPLERVDEILERLFKKGLVGVRDTDKGLLFRHRYVGEYFTKDEAYIAQGATPRK